LTETLISSLSKLGDLSVKSRSAVFAYKGRETTPKQIGVELGVQAVLLGRLVHRGDNINLNLELVNAKTQDVIWADQYDRKQADLVNLQTEIARDVSSKLKSKLSGNDQQALNKKYTDDPEAYRLYLEARFYLNKRVGKEYEKAEGYLRQAIERDPNFALGYTGLAEFIGQRDRPKAKEYITRALAIDDQLSDAHALLGFQYTLDRDWAMAERELTKAIELDPDNWRALQWNGTRQIIIGHYDECLRTLDKAINIDPTMSDLRTTRAACLVAAGRVDDGIAAIKSALEIDPSYPWSFSQLSFIYRLTGDRAASVEARAHAEELLDRPDLAKRLRAAFAAGWTVYLREVLDQTKENFRSPTRRASILAELGRKDEALAALEQSAADGDWWLFSIKYDPAFDPLRDDPRFQAILKQFDAPQ
jgi:tetratricopeptide (TPR) repeat protein